MYLCVCIDRKAYILMRIEGTVCVRIARSRSVLRRRRSLYRAGGAVPSPYAGAASSAIEKTNRK